MKLVVVTYLQAASCLKASSKLPGLLTFCRFLKGILYQTFVKNSYLNGGLHLQNSSSRVTWCILHKFSFHFFKYLLLFENRFTTQVTAIFTKYSTLYISFIHLQYFYLFISFCFAHFSYTTYLSIAFLDSNIGKSKPTTC